MTKSKILTAGLVLLIALMFLIPYLTLGGSFQGIGGILHPEGNPLVHRYGTPDTLLDAGAKSELTIASGVIQIRNVYHSIDTASDGASDDLDTINGGQVGAMAVLYPAHTDRTVVLKNGTGNIVLDADISLDDSTDRVVLIYDGTYWQLLSTVTQGTIIASGLTATRVTFAGTGGLLTDDSDMTFATDTLTVTKLGATTLTGTIAGGTNTMTGMGSINGLVITADTGAITTGTWTGTVVSAVYGGTGVANNVASTLTISGAYATTLTVTGATGVTLPTTGTLATLAGTEELDNKTLDSSVGKGTWTASGTWTLPSFVTTDAATIEIGAAGVVKSGATNTDTLLLAANDTTFITFTTAATDVMTIANATMSGTWLASGTVTVPALTLGGTVTTNGQVFDAGAGSLEVSTTGSLVGLIINGSNASQGARARFNYNDTTPIVGAVLGGFAFHGYDGNGTPALIRYGLFAANVKSVTDAAEEVYFRWLGATGGVEDNVAMELTGAGILTVDSALVAGIGEGSTIATTGRYVRAPNIAVGGAGNVAGSDLYIAGGLGTGTGDVGQIIFSTAQVAGAGDNLQSLETILTLDEDLVTLGKAATTTSYHEFTEMAAPGQGAANTARIYALQGAGDALTDLCAVFQDATIVVFAEEATELDAPTFRYPSNTATEIVLKKPHPGLVEFFIKFPDGTLFPLRSIQYHDAEKIAANLGAEGPLPADWVVTTLQERVDVQVDKLDEALAHIESRVFGILAGMPYDDPELAAELVEELKNLEKEGKRLNDAKTLELDRLDK
uniref:Uncharacterized protein n=1 Tax=viral metagenome TaxID=1070528 RepID=A0A6M3JT29_9ZZZZ